MFREIYLCRMQFSYPVFYGIISHLMNAWEKKFIANQILYISDKI